MEEESLPKYMISVAAELAGVHPQTLRDYEKRGLLRPGRTAGNTRLYSDDDIEAVRHIQELVEDGVNLVGVEKIVTLQENFDDLQARHDRLVEGLRGIERRASDVIAGSAPDSAERIRTDQVNIARKGDHGG